MVHIPRPVQRAHITIGEQLKDQRKILGLTARMVAQRAQVSLTTLRNIEQGRSVGLDPFLRVLHVLQMLDGVKKATDPFETDLGRIRASMTLKQRVRPDRGPRIEASPPDPA